MHAIITNKAHSINMSKIAKTILTFLPKLATYHNITYFIRYVTLKYHIHKICIQIISYLIENHVIGYIFDTIS